MPKIETDLYRAIKEGTFDSPFIVEGKAVDGLLYPRFHDTSYINASGEERTSSADVTLYNDAVTKAEMVKTGGGTSMFDVSGWFGPDSWEYFHVPKDTEYSEGLYIKKGKNKRKSRDKTLSGRHYQIEPKNPMTVDAYKGALNNFARAAIAKQVQNAK